MRGTWRRHNRRTAKGELKPGIWHYVLLFPGWNDKGLCGGVVYKAGGRDERSDSVPDDRVCTKCKKAATDD